MTEDQLPDPLPSEELLPPPLTIEPQAEVPSLPSQMQSHLAELRNLTHELRDGYQEWERLRNGIAKPVRPFLNEILSIRDDLTRLMEYYAQGDAVDPQDVVANLDGLRTELDQLLIRRDIVPISIEAPIFDRDTQRAVRVVPTAIPEEDLTVVAELRAGFRGPDGIVRRTDVSIRRFKPSESK